MIHLIEKAKTLQEALPYIQQFRDSIIVVKFGGSAMENPKITQSILKDVVMMECIGMKPVIVHGGGNAISAELNKANIPTVKIAGQRKTCERSIGIVENVLVNQVNANLVKQLGHLQAKAIGINGKQIITAEKLYVNDESGKKQDIGFVGKVTDVQTDFILNALEKEIIPVIAPIGKDEKGQIYNINADLAAADIAKALKARKLAYLSDVPGILKDYTNPDTLISSIRINSVQKYIQDGIISGGMIPKVESAVSAIEFGTKKVHMIDGNIEHSLLLELFTAEGIGTEITA